MEIQEHIAGLRAVVKQQYETRMAAIDSLERSFTLETVSTNSCSHPENQPDESNRQNGLSISGCVREVLDDDVSDTGLTVLEVIQAVTDRLSVDCLSNKNNRGAVSAALSNLKKRGVVVQDSVTKRYRSATLDHGGEEDNTI